MRLPAIVAVVMIAAVISVLGIGVATGYVDFYNGLNKGITAGNCGFEVVGEFGPFCGDY